MREGRAVLGAGAAVLGTSTTDVLGPARTVDECSPDRSLGRPDQRVSSRTSHLTFVTFVGLVSKSPYCGRTRVPGTAVLYTSRHVPPIPQACRNRHLAHAHRLAERSRAGVGVGVV